MPEPLPTVYIETSVVSYLTSRHSRDIIVLGHQQITAAWWENLHNHFDPYISELVTIEAKRGDLDAATRRLKALEPFKVLDVSDAARDLASEYLDHLPVPRAAEADCLHLALASLYEIEYLVTWNCWHIAHGAVKRAVLNYNQRRGLSTPTICTPEELLDGYQADLD